MQIIQTSPAKMTTPPFTKSYSSCVPSVGYSDSGWRLYSINSLGDVFFDKSHDYSLSHPNICILTLAMPKTLQVAFREIPSVLAFKIFQIMLTGVLIPFKKVFFVSKNETPQEIQRSICRNPSLVQKRICQGNTFPWSYN